MNIKTILYFLLLAISLEGIAQSASPRVKVLELDAPQLDTTRTIRIYLPEGYENSKEHYPVVYMHDAQNLFDTTTAFSGEWMVDEFFDSQNKQKMIVVGVDHGNHQRINELTPFPNEKYGGGEGDSYVDFLVKTLKPYIDSTYRSLPDAEHTAIMGSSLGGLISFYAALKYPEIYGKAGIFSPSFWFNEKIYDFAEASDIERTTKFYILGGSAEDESLVPNLERMEKLLLKKGLPRGNISLKIVEGGEHNEAFWSREFPEAIGWLFPFKDEK